MPHREQINSVVSSLLLATVLGGSPLASYTSALVGADNDIKLTARIGGTGGNAITIALVDPSGNNQPLGVTVSELAISVSLATGVAGAITSTAAQVVAAINADAAAKMLVVATVKTGDAGTGIVTALGAANLTGGDAAAITTAGVDCLGFDSLAFNIHAGAVAPAPTSIVMEESDDNSAFTPVATAEQQGRAAIADWAVSTTLRLAYTGIKRYARLVITPNGATDLTVTIAKGYPAGRPTLNPAA
jgi:hypothetical protein